MLTCPVCQKPNHHLAVTCKSCGSFLQTRVDTLDLFSTMWRVIERPAKAFHQIAISQHKNYIVVLSSLSGVGLLFAVFWLIHAGDHAESTVSLILAGLTLGLPFGVVTVLLFSAIVLSMASIMKAEVRFLNLYAVTSYGLLPVIFSLVFLLPIELQTFGKFFFSLNPSPYLIKPSSYVMMLVLDGLVGIWTILLLTLGIRVLLAIDWLKSFMIVITAIILLAGVYLGLIQLFFPSATLR